MQPTLNATTRMPMIGFGTYLIDNDDVQPVVLEALRAGYRHIDTAEAYGNEPGSGAAIRSGMQELGLTRDDVFVTTKLWCGNEDWGQPFKTYQSTMESLDQSLSNLQMDYVDLYLIHAPLAGEQRLEQWRALVDLQLKLMTSIWLLLRKWTGATASPGASATRPGYPEKCAIGLCFKLVVDRDKATP